MDISFDSAALAALCNSERRLADRWGVDAGHMVGRRLFELGSADPHNFDRLPRASVSADGQGDMTIDFVGELIVRGRLDSNGTGTDRFVITGLDVQRDT